MSARIAVAACLLLLWGVDPGTPEPSAPATDMECYEACLGTGATPDECEWGLMNSEPMPGGI